MYFQKSQFYKIAFCINTTFQYNLQNKVSWAFYVCATQKPICRERNREKRGIEVESSHCWQVVLASHSFTYVKWPRFLLPFQQPRQYSSSSSLQEPFSDQLAGIQNLDNGSSRKMALKFHPLTSQSPKLPSFAMPQLASLRSPKFVMASTLRSTSRQLLFLFPHSTLMLFRSL